jgi:hypothetical protein
MPWAVSVLETSGRERGKKKEKRDLWLVQSINYKEQTDRHGGSRYDAI